MVTGLPKALPPNGFCKGVVLGKHHQAPFNSGNAWHALALLQLVHSDRCYISKLSLEGERYVLKFINDLFHYTWVYFLKNKSHVFESFKEFRALAKNKCSYLVKCLRSGNGGEYVSR